jgi:hypothetical protein
MADETPGVPTDPGAGSGTPPPREHRHEVDEPTIFPKWVPLLIGVVLIAMAALAVFTGLRYRDNGLALVHPRKSTPRSAPAAGPPGEPDAGASVMFPGDSADNVPNAQPAVSGRARAEVTNGANGVNAVVRMWARRGMSVKATPADAMVYVNETPVGAVSQLDPVYEFPAAGSYNVRVVAPGYAERQYIVTATETAKDEIANIQADLKPQK